MEVILKQRMMNKIVSLVLMVVGSMMLSFMMIGNVSATSLTLTSSGSQSIDVAPAAGTAISSDSINVTTTCRYGYNFTIQTSVDDNILYLNGDPENFEITNFWPTDGTTPLNETENEWGYFYDGNTVPTNTSAFSTVPMLSDEPALIKSPLDSPASSDINDTFNIYYGVSVSPTTTKGTYKLMPDRYGNDGTIIYTAIAADSCIQYTVQFSPTSTSTGSTVTGYGTMDSQTMYEGLSDAIAINDFVAPSGYYFVGWNTAQDGSGTFYSDEQVVTDLTTAGNTVTLYAMWDNCPGNNICYIANGTNIIGSMGKQAIASTDTEATLYAPNYKRDDYGFVSWNTSPDGSGTDYGPNETISFTAGQYSSSGLKLYANWLDDSGDMQDWGSCSYMNIGDVTALRDTRDDNVYAVAKLADDNCWMIENLRLDNAPNLTTTNTHNPSLPLTNSWWYSSANDNDTQPTSSHLSATTNPTITAWCQTDSSNCDDQSMLATNNTTLFTNNTASGYSAGGNVYSYGNYYNWYSATGGHGKYGSSYGSSFTAPGDICPAGWHLPTGKDATGDFGVLDIALGGTGAYSDSSTTPTGATMSLTYRSYPNNFVYSGTVDGSSVGYRSNIYGGYWSASGSNDSNAFFMSLESTYVNTATIRAKKYPGRTIRCVADT